MSNMLARGAAMLNRTMKASASESVTYSRGSDAVSVSATPGNTITEMPVDDNGGTIQSRNVDFLIDGPDLILDSATITPRPGDRITRADGTVFEVNALGSEPCFRRSNPHGTLLRIHAILIQG